MCIYQRLKTFSASHTHFVVGVPRCVCEYISSYYAYLNLACLRYHSEWEYFVIRLA